MYKRSLLLLLPLLIAADGAGRIDVTVEGLRSSKGVVRVCLTKSAAHFPDCKKDPQSRSHTLPAGGAKSISFADLPPGHYAIALFHDENSNTKLDTMLAIPKEGFGFSRNPKIRFGAPPFKQVAFPVAAAPVKVSVRMQYFL